MTRWTNKFQIPKGRASKVLVPQKEQGLASAISWIVRVLPVDYSFIAFSHQLFLLFQSCWGKASSRRSKTKSLETYRFLTNSPGSPPVQCNGRSTSRQKNPPEFFLIGFLSRHTNDLGADNWRNNRCSKVLVTHVLKTCVFQGYPGFAIRVATISENFPNGSNPMLYSS